MDSVAVTVPLRPPTKKMKKRKELDALAPPHAITRRGSGKRSSQELLMDSSDDRSEYWSFSTRGGRKCRGRRSQTCPGILRACTAFLACASVLATATLIWLFIDVRQQLTALRTELDQVIAGSESVPDELQKCHSFSKELQINQTTIFWQLSELKHQIDNFTLQISGIQQALHDVQEKLKTSPAIMNIPNEYAAFKVSVVKFGSQIANLEDTVKSLKETDTKIQGTQSTMLQNITSIEHSLTELSNDIQKPQTFVSNESRAETEELSSAISQLKTNLTRINETLSTKIQWTTDDMKKDETTLVSLKEMAANVSSKVESLQVECAKSSEQTAIVANVTKLSEQLTDAQTDLTNRVKQLEKSTNDVLASLSTMRKQQQTTVARQETTRATTLATPGNNGGAAVHPQEQSSAGRDRILENRSN